MIKYYFKIALRHLMRNKAFSFINIFGLSIGMACCFVILLFVKNELNYDGFHEKGELIYRMALERIYPGRSSDYAFIPPSYAADLVNEYPEVEETVRLFAFPGSMTIKVGEDIYEEENRVWADSNFFDIFSFPLIAGEASEVLKQPNTVVLTSTTAKKYFGDENPIGKVLDIPQNEEDLLVTGVCKDVPKNSHIKFDLLISSKSLAFLEQPNHVSFSAYTYLKLAANTNAKVLENKFPDLVTKFASGEINRNFGVSYKEYQANGNGYRYFLQPLKGIYLESNLEGEMKPPGSKTTVYIFTIIAFFILFIACVNFMNLSTARSSDRAKEVGIRKTLGSEKREISFQFLFESVLLSIISAAFALAIIQVLIPLFNNMAETDIAMNQVANWKVFLLFLFAPIVIGLLAGLYPAFILSNFKPLEVLRGKLWSTGSGALMRNSLVVTQFVISVVLIISTIVVFYQLEFLQNKELGFNKENIITLKGANALSQQQVETFKNQVRDINGVSAVGGCTAMPGGSFFGSSFRAAGENETVTGKGLVIDEGYLSCMNIELIEGRSYAKEFEDSLSVIINETALKNLGITNPVGQYLASNDFTGADKEFINYRIVGVIKDFHFESLHQEITPLFLVHLDAFRAFEGRNPLISIRLSPPNIQQSILQIEKIWTKHLPEQVFRFDFLDSELNQLYKAEQTSKRVFGFFTMLGIFIACLGLLGLAAYDTQRRTKEIGIRKVLGASVANIVGLLSINFLKLVLIALLIACPIAWYAMTRWLQDFAYSINLSWWIFALAGFLAVLITFLTISFQTIKAAIANPVKSLRSD